MNVKPVVRFMTCLLENPGGIWSSILSEGSDPTTSIILAVVTVVGVAVQIVLIYKTARRGHQNAEDSEAAVQVYLPVCLHGDPLFYHRAPNDQDPG